MDWRVQERGCRTLFLTEVVRHLEKIRRKNSDNLRRSLRRRSRSPNVLVRSSKGKGFSNGSGSGYVQTGVCVLRGLGEGYLRKNGGDQWKRSSGSSFSYGAEEDISS